MAAKKVQVPCWVDPQIKGQIQAFADKEKRPLGNLCAFLVEWAVTQLQEAGNSLVLQDWKAGPIADGTKVPEISVPSDIAKKINAQVKQLVDQHMAAEAKVEGQIRERIGPSKRKRGVHQ